MWFDNIARLRDESKVFSKEKRCSSEFFDIIVDIAPFALLQVLYSDPEFCGLDMARMLVIRTFLLRLFESL